MRNRAITFAGILSLLAAFALSACGSEPAFRCPDDGQTECEAELCYDLRVDINNCGACGTVCGAGEICENSACVSSCAANELYCGGGCIDPTIDRNYCGAQADCQGGNAGIACLEGQDCVDRGCQCSPDRVECEANVCANLQNDVAHCGSCFNACRAGASCIEGTCRANVTLAGALPPATGRWNFGGTPGLDGANILCETEWAGSHVCYRSELEWAAGQTPSELMGASDTAGNTVLAVWIDDPTEVATLQCYDSATETRRWTYATGHLGVFGNYATVDADGLLGALEAGACNGATQNIPCCYEATGDGTPLP